MQSRFTLFALSSLLGLLLGALAYLLAPKLWLPDSVRPLQPAGASDSSPIVSAENRNSVEQEQTPQQASLATRNQNTNPQSNPGLPNPTQPLAPLNDPQQRQRLSQRVEQGSQQSDSPRFTQYSYYDAIMRVAPSVVSVYSSARRRPAANGTEDPNDVRERLSTNQGSGVIIDSEGLILTNFHLVEGADEIRVVLNDGSLHEGRVIGQDRETDIAIVGIDAIGLPSAALAAGSRLRVGDVVLAIGNPFGVGQTVTQGIVSATRRRIAGGSAWQNFVQIDAAINPGNSGGALITPDGALVGINTAVFLRDNGAEGIGFAITSELLARVVPQMIAEGRVIRGWLGIGADDLPMFPAIHRFVDRGAVISAILPNGPGAAGGLQLYDVVTQVADEKVSTATELLLAISAIAPGESVPITYWRQGQQSKTDVMLGERPPG